MPATWDATIQVDPSDATAPVITSVAVPASGYYGIGSALEFTVNFDEPVEVVNVTGLPQLSITVGGVARQAGFVSGSTTTALLFSYTVTSGENGGVAVTGLDLNGGTIKDANGNDADLTFNGVGDTSGITVYTDDVVIAKTVFADKYSTPLSGDIEVNYIIHRSGDKSFVAEGSTTITEGQLLISDSALAPSTEYRVTILTPDHTKGAPFFYTTAAA